MNQKHKNHNSKTAKLFVNFVELHSSQNLHTELSEEELQLISGGAAPTCPQYTTLACYEEANGCSGC